MRRDSRAAQEIYQSSVWEGRDLVLGTHLAIEHDPLNHPFIHLVVDVDRTDPIRMPHHRDLGLILDALYQRLASSRHDQVDVLLLRQQRRDLAPRCDRLDRGRGELGLAQSSLNELVQQCGGMHGFFTSL